MKILENIRAIVEGKRVIRKATAKVRKMSQYELSQELERLKREAEDERFADMMELERKKMIQRHWEIVLKALN